MQYKVSNNFSGPLPGSPHGFYNELLITNSTNVNIGVIDKFGNKFVVKPDNQLGRTDLVKIYTRSDLGNKMENGQYKTMPTVVCTVTLDALNTGDNIYVKEADVVVCNEPNLKYFEHPNRSLSTEDAVKVLLQDMRKRDILKVPTVKVIANDPSGKINVVYVYILNQFCEVIPTHYTSSDNGVSIIFPNDGMRITNISFPEIEAAGGYINNDYIECFIGLNKDVLRSAIDQVRSRSTNKFSEVDIEKLKREMELEYDKRFKEEIGHIERRWANKIKADMLEKDELINELKNKIDSLEKLLNSSEGFLNMLGKKMSHEEKEMKLKMTKTKFGIELLKIFGPAVVGFVVAKLMS